MSFYINRAGAEAYGALSLLLVVFTYLQMFDLGIGYAVNTRLARRLARCTPDAAVVVRRAIPFYLATAVWVTIVLWITAPSLSRMLFHSDDYIADLRVLSLSIVFLMLSALCTAVLNAHNRVDLVNGSRLLLDLLRAGALGIGAQHGGDLQIIVWAMVVGSVLKFGVDLLLASRTMRGGWWAEPDFRWGDMKLNFTFGLPMMMTVVIGLLLNSVDKLYVAQHFSQYDVANYNIAFDINTKAYFIIWALNGSLYNIFVRRGALGRDRRDLVKLSFLLASAMALTVYVPIAMFSERILGLWINPEFAHSAHEYVSLMAFPASLYLFMSVAYNVVQSSGRGKVILAGDLLSLVALLCGIAALTPSLGIKGIILAYAMAYLLQGAFLLRYMRQTLSDTREPTERPI